MLETKNHTRSQNNTFPLIFVVSLLYSIYLLTYNGVPLSDDEHLFAAVSKNLTITHNFQAEQLLGNMRLLGQYNNIGPLHPLIGSFVIRIIRPLDHLGIIQSLYFLSPFYTALSAGLLYWYTQQKGYTFRTRIFTSLAFGLSSIAWTYTQTYYREPLAMLLFLAAYLFFELLIENKIPAPRRPWFWAGWGMFLFLAVLTKVYFILSLPLFLLRMFLNRKSRSKGDHHNFWKMLSWGIIIICALWFLADKFNLTNTSRLNHSFFQYTLEILAGRFKTFALIPALTQLSGVLLSPAKGFFIYTPITFFGLTALFIRKKIKPENHIIPLGTIAVFIAAQLFTYWDSWWNISWSTRFLLPVLPMVFILLIPLIQFSLESDLLWYRIGLFSLTIAGVIIQISGVLLSDSTYLARLYAQENILDVSETIWRFDLMPATYHWKMLMSGESPSIAIARNAFAYPALIFTIGIILLALIGMLSFILFRMMRGGTLPKIVYNPLTHRFLPIYTLVLLPIFLLIAYRSDPMYFASWRALQNATQRLEEAVTPEDIVLVASYQTPAWYYLMNFERFSTPWYSLPEQPANWQKTFQTIDENFEAKTKIWLLVEEHMENQAINMLELSYLQCKQYAQFYNMGSPPYFIELCNTEKGWENENQN